MSLLLWEYYLDPVDWGVGSPVVTTTSASAANAGSGNYTGPSADFWDIREAALARHVPPVLTPQTTADTAPRPPNPADEAALAAALAQSKQVILDIQKEVNDYYTQAASILLLDLF